MDNLDYLVIGAGLAGLSCARTLAEAGKSVRVLERSSRVGGRCASRVVDAGAEVDFGPVFVHGDDADFLGWVESFGDELVAGWPRRVEGTGTPCQPQAFDPWQRRFALKPGMRRLAESLGRGLDVVTSTPIEGLAWGDGVAAVTADGRRFSARHGVVATALEQTRGLLDTLPSEEPLRGIQRLLAQFSSLPCLAVLAEYGPEAPVLPWEVFYPEASRVLLMVSNEGTKRISGSGLLMFQARPRWSADRLEAERDGWTKELLAEAAALLGPWAAQPSASSSHRWKYGRISPSDHLVRPVILERPGSAATWGLTGDLFDPDGGLQGAWRSGHNLAQRLLAR